jgi:hypothetical protein
MPSAGSDASWVYTCMKHGTESLGKTVFAPASKRFRILRRSRADRFIGRLTTYRFVLFHIPVSLRISPSKRSTAWAAVPSAGNGSGATRKQVAACFEEERPHLQPLPGSLFPCFTGSPLFVVIRPTQIEQTRNVVAATFATRTKSVRVPGIKPERHCANCGKSSRCTLEAHDGVPKRHRNSV